MVRLLSMFVCIYLRPVVNDNRGKTILVSWLQTPRDCFPLFTDYIGLVPKIDFTDLPSGLEPYSMVI